jgi:hypothetical protein
MYGFNLIDFAIDDDRPRPTQTNLVHSTRCSNESTSHGYQVPLCLSKALARPSLFLFTILPLFPNRYPPPITRTNLASRRPSRRCPRSPWHNPNQTTNKTHPLAPPPPPTSILLPLLPLHPNRRPTRPSTKPPNLPRRGNRRVVRPATPERKSGSSYAPYGRTMAQVLFWRGIPYGGDGNCG